MTDRAAIITGIAIVAALVIGIYAGTTVTGAGQAAERIIVEEKLASAERRIAGLAGELEAMVEARSLRQSIVVAFDALTSHYTEASSGGLMSSGRPFDEDALTAAHRTLKNGTILLLENPANGRLVPVSIQDWGPARWTGRDLDVSLAAARRLGIVRQGEARLRCYLKIMPSDGDRP